MKLNCYFRRLEELIKHLEDTTNTQDFELKKLHDTNNALKQKVEHQEEYIIKLEKQIQEMVMF